MFGLRDSVGEVLPGMPSGRMIGSETQHHIPIGQCVRLNFIVKNDMSTWHFLPHG